MKLSLSLLTAALGLLETLTALNLQIGPVCQPGTTLPKGMTDQMYALPGKYHPTKIRIAFVGDSITMGGGSKRDDALLELGGFPINGVKLNYQGYPFLLSKILTAKGIADQFELLNFGFDWRQAMNQVDVDRLQTPNKDGGSYSASCDYQQALQSSPNAVIFMLGTNDIIQVQADKYYDNGGNFERAFTDGFLQLTRSLKALPSRPVLYVMIPPPIMLRQSNKDLVKDLSAFLSTQWLPDKIRQLAQQIPIPTDHVINLQEIFSRDRLLNGEGGLLMDGIHPSYQGHQEIAQKVFDAVIGDKDNFNELRDGLYKIGMDDKQQ